jgi:hypothetical protein
MNMNVLTAEMGAFKMHPKIQNDDASHSVTNNFH